MVLCHWQEMRPPVLESGTREHHSGVAVLLSECFENSQLATGIGDQVFERLSEAPRRAGMAGEWEHRVDADNELQQKFGIRCIACDELDLLERAVETARDVRCTGIVDETRHAPSVAHQPARDMRPKEASGTEHEGPSHYSTASGDQRPIVRPRKRGPVRHSPRARSASATAPRNSPTGIES
ncbi:MAG: hypothetical protein JWO37_3003 [Acidimicrobiales bacterium]|nr:hypothetical protein [Acidimicrobiales bacterium]